VRLARDQHHARRGGLVHAREVADRKPRHLLDELERRPSLSFIDDDLDQEANERSE